MPATRLADINVDNLTREQLVHLLDCWGYAIHEEAKRRVHGERVPPGAENVVNWIDRTSERLERRKESLEDTKTRIREFLGRLSMLEGIPLEVDLEAP